MHGRLPPECGASGGAQRILVVDDEPLLLRLVEEKLSREGYEVSTAPSGPEALDLIRRWGLPHLGLVDILMPGMNGFEFCRAVHQYCDLPIILLSAVSDRGTVTQGIREHAEDYITKPFHIDELVARVERVLRRIGDFSFALKPVIAVADGLVVDFPRQEAIVEGRPVHLTSTESRLLHILMSNAGRMRCTRWGSMWMGGSIL